MYIQMEGIVEPIYKISHLVDNRIRTLYVFCGKTYKNTSVEALDLLFVKTPEAPLFAEIFTPEELEEITQNTISVQFIPERLHLDDTLEIIKKKLMYQLIDDLNLNASFDEIYFFIRQSENFQALTIYQNLTQNDKLALTKDRLIQYLLNIDEIDVNTLPEKDIYTFEDIYNLEQSNVMVSKPLGHHFVSVNHDYPYTVNPFDVESYDPFLEKFAVEMTTTVNKNLLMRHGAFYNNTIYLCLAANVLAYAIDNNLSEASTLKIYYPYLASKEITSLEELTERKQTLITETKEMFTPAFIKNIGNINLFYDIYANRKADMKFTDMGIKSINLNINQASTFNLPLDIVFKLIHATQDIPLIKMNLSKRRENIYRLYTDKMATNGKKIPYLEKGTIFKWDKVMGKNKSVTVYIEYYDEELTPILCEFSSNGAINIKATFNKSIKADDVNELLIKQVNPVINIVKEYLAQGGYTMTNFTAMNDPSVEIVNIDFSMAIDISKKMNIKNMAGCLTSIFNIINSDLKQGILLRFKRVANYNEMESQEALILDMSQPHLNYSDEDIIKVIQANFQMTENAARTKYIEVKRAQELMNTGNRRLKTRNNPGFLTSITQQQHGTTVLINVSGINDIKYLDIVYIYLDSLLRLTQSPTSTAVGAEDIAKLCKGQRAEEEEKVTEMVAIIEQTGQMNIVGEELVVSNTGEEEEEFDIDEEDLYARFGLDEDEQDEQEQSEAEQEQSDAEEGGGPEKDEDDDEDTLKTDITGLNLSNPSPFESRMVKRDKHLFISDTGKKNMKSYATTCAWNRLRHPVILTDDEKDRIDKEHPGSYSQAVKYGSKPDKKFWYICPRYWSLKDNTSLREDEVNKAEIIPAKSDKGKYVVPKGKHIFEFNDYGIEHMDADKNYKTHYPGFIKPNENGVCLPCCFSSWDKDEQVKRRAQCTNDKTIALPEGRKKKKNEEDIDEYILSHDKFPITQENRFGYLPLAVQNFLHTDNKKCQISDLNTNIKPNHICLLRHSVEIHQTQSFIGCLAEVWRGVSPNDTLETIKEMKEILIAALDVDLFITLQNGNLVKQFYKEETMTDYNDLETYANVFSQNNSKIYENADKSKPAQVNALIKIARAYNNFIAYLRDDTVEIDSEYLWDLICKPNPKLFPTGMNMIIIELSRKDVTDNVEILCPSNHYSSTFFDMKKRSFLILKIENFYEPIFSYESNKDAINIQRYFSIMNNELLPNIRHTLTLINRVFAAKCLPRPSMPLVYAMEKNISLERLVAIVTTTAPFSGFAIENQVKNYDNKIIGIILRNNQDNTKGFIPCYPSAPLRSASTAGTSTAGTSTASDDALWMDHVYTDTYENTRDFLESIYKKSRREIPCKPFMKVFENGLIVGILTKTNQFVLISEPVQDTFGDDLKVMEGSNNAAADQTISTSDQVDDNRVNFIKKIQLESNFYNVFRNTARYLLGQYNNKDIRYEIDEKTNSTQLYLKKLRSVETLLRELMANHISFHAYDEAELLKLPTITSCYNNCENKPYCISDISNSDISVSESNSDIPCKLLIPEINLINQKSNNIFYYGKLADEIIRYSRIKTFIFNPKTVLSFSNLKYNLRENEIILLQSLLTQEYFENITLAKKNQYITTNTYDTTEPILAQNYSNSDTLENIETYEVLRTQKNTTLCDITIKDHISNKYFSDLFPLGSKEYIYVNNNNSCYFKPILDIIQTEKTNEQALTSNALKEILAEAYRALYDTYKPKLISIFKAQGKKELAALLEANKVNFYDMLISEEYYPTNIDLWLLAIHYKLPLVFLSDTELMENNNKFMVVYSDGNNDAFYFLKASATSTHTNNPLTFTLIRDATGNAKIPVASLRILEIQQKIRTAQTEHNLVNFITKFVAPKTIVKIMRKKTEIAKGPATALEPTALEPTAPTASGPLVPSEPAALEPAALEPAALEPAALEPAAPEPLEPAAPEPAALEPKKKTVVKKMAKKIKVVAPSTQ